MPCRHIGNAIVCGPRERKRHCRCGYVSLYQCDYPVGRGTCDRHLCAACATEVGPDRHYCPEHVKVEPAPQQQGLFP